MLQEIAVYLIIVVSLLWAVYLIYKKKNQPKVDFCSSCNGCEIKKITKKNNKAANKNVYKTAVILR